MSTSESTILPNAAPMITPTAKSTTLPLKAKFLNSSNRDQVCCVGVADAICFIGLLDTTRFRGLIIGSLSPLGSQDAPLLLLAGVASCCLLLAKDERLHPSLRVCQTPSHGVMGRLRSVRHASFRLCVWYLRNSEDEAVARLHACERSRRHSQHNRLSFGCPHPHAMRCRINTGDGPSHGALGILASDIGCRLGG